jgi:hypothetical protein
MRTKLEKKYQNDHDAGYTYIDPTGISIPLTPFMMKEWARGLVRLLLSILILPNQ